MDKQLELNTEFEISAIHIKAAQTLTKKLANIGAHVRVRIGDFEFDNFPEEEPKRVRNLNRYKAYDLQALSKMQVGETRRVHLLPDTDVTPNQLQQRVSAELVNRFGGKGATTTSRGRDAQGEFVDCLRLE